MQVMCLFNIRAFLFNVCEGKSTLLDVTAFRKMMMEGGSVCLSDSCLRC